MDGLYSVHIFHMCLLSLFTILAGSSTIIIYWFVLGTSLYFIHRIGHYRVWRRWYIAHVIGHHSVAYPAKRFLSQNYKENKQDSYNLNSWIYVIIASIVIICLKNILKSSLDIVILASIQIILNGLIENYIHTEIHKTNSKLNNYIWFQSLRSLHRIHHCGDNRCNYAMSAWIFDWVYGTLKI